MSVNRIDTIISTGTQPIMATFRDPMVGANSGIYWGLLIVTGSDIKTLESCFTLTVDTPEGRVITPDWDIAINEKEVSSLLGKVFEVIITIPLPSKFLTIMGINILNLTVTTSDETLELSRPFTI